MTGFGLALVVGVPLLVLLVVLEGRRQARIYGPPSARPNLAGAGLLRGEAAKLAGASRVPAKTSWFLSRKPASVLLVYQRVP